MDILTHFMEKVFNKPYPSMECKCTTKEIEQIIKSHKTNNSYVYNDISTKILKIVCPFISSPTNYISNNMFFWVVFPFRLKYTIIKPLYKNRERCGVSNYRPVSLLISFWKVFEMVMQRSVLKHLTNYNIQSSEHYGFRLELGTDNATYKLTLIMQLTN